MQCLATNSALGGLLLAGTLGVGVLATTPAPSAGSLKELQELPAVVKTLKAPALEEPQWLKKQIEAEKAAALAQKKTVTYSVSTRGAITANVSEFNAQVDETLNDARGWAGLGVHFQQVASGGSFTVVLTEASQVPSFSSGCSELYSCNVGNFVIINQDRWLGASNSWNQAGGTLRNYRHMVVNHETGHWLGHGHKNCGGPGQPAPVMQQQSIDLQGCTFNSWPLESELWSSRLGINKS